MTYWRIVMVLGVVSVVLGASGCSREIHPATTSLSGKVTVDGRPISSGVVVAYQGGSKVMETSIETDGSYVFTNPKNGEYQLTVTNTEIASSPGRSPMKLPAKYAKPESSGLTATVTSDQTNTQDLLLQTK